MKLDATGRDPSRAKYDIAYSTAVPTPHVPWARPYVNGDIRAFFISSIHEGRTVSELMQRLSLEVRAVSIDPRWDVNKWCIDRYAHFDNLVPKDYSLAYAALAPELTAPTPYDVIVMHSMRGWNDLPTEVKQAILSRVKAGAGWVFVHPHLGEDGSDQSIWDILPLTNVAPTTMKSPGAGIDEGYPKDPAQAMSGASWQKAADHYVVNGLPFEALPYPALQHYQYNLGKGAQALVTGVDGRPVVALKTYGKGRIVALGYKNYALFPRLEATRGELNENFWEYLFSLLMRSIIWAAKKEPQVTVTAVTTSATKLALARLPQSRVSVRLHNAGDAKSVKVTTTFRDAFRAVESEVVNTVRLRPGLNEVTVPLPAGPAAGGRHFADVQVSAGGKQVDWGTGTYEVARPARVSKVKLDAEAVPAGGRVTGAATVTGKGTGLTLQVELWDNLGRKLGQQSLPVGKKRSVPFALSCPEALTHAGWVKCRLLEGDRFLDEGRAPIVLTAPRRVWQDYEVIVPWLHDGFWPWSDLIEQQYRRAGMTSTSDTRYNFPLTVSMHPPGFGIYWYRRHDYVKRREEYGRTKDKSLLVRHPCFHKDEFRQPVASALRKGIPPILKYSPLAYFIADESSVTAYEDAFDLCWSPETLAEFRKWLRGLYRTVEALNAEWGTKYRSWEKVMPATWEEAQARGNPAPWVDHRLFMNRTLVNGFKYARDVAQRIDPEGMVTVSGTQIPGSHNGCDWWQMDRIVQYLQPYSGGGQDEMHRSFNPHMLLTGFTGYSQQGTSLAYEIWHRFLHGHCGASIFWGYSFVDPDLTLNGQGRTFEQTFGELRGEGLSRQVHALTRRHDKIALHFSMASGHVWWIKDGKLTYKDMESGTRSSQNFRRFLQNRVAWGTLLEDIGYQYNYVSYEQVENGEFAQAGYKALILPGSIALSNKEVAQIKDFVKRGGTVIADVMPGLTTVHGKPLAESSLAEIFAAPKYGRGRAYCPNAWADEYLRGRTEPLGEEARALLRGKLSEWGVHPRVSVTGAKGVFPVTVERVSWNHGGLEVLALLKEMRGTYRESSDGVMHYEEKKGIPAVEKVKVTAAPGHWYDLRTHTYLGEMSELRLTLKEADPKVLARLPYQVKGLKLTVEGGKTPGETAQYAVSLNTGSAKAATHVVKIEVFAPNGEKHLAYSKNMDTRNGAGAGQFRLALNDAPGAWRLVATDVISGASAEKTWRVK